jgi:hypothetical protein
MAPDLALRPPTARLRIRFRWEWLAAAIAAVVFFTVIPPALTSPPTVPRVGFVNPTAYAIDIQITDARRDGQMDLGTAGPQATTVVQTVIDQGGTWIVHFTSQGHDGGEVVVARATLRSSGWQISIPDAVGTQLAREGTTPTPLPGR